MNIRANHRILLVLPLVGLALGGCVSQREYDNLVETNRSLRNTNFELQASLDECQRSSSGLRGNSSSADASIRELEDTNATLRQQLSGARDMIAGLESRLGDLQFTSLDPTTDRALSNLADEYPGLITYDADRGMLRFASDLTFDSGSAVVKDSAKESIRALANILTSRASSGYDVRVVGHTDSQRISAGTAQRHPTNMHLSVHRAIAVRQELASLNVEPARMESAGWGEFRPIVANNARGGTPANRRVEIFLVANSFAGDAPASTGGNRSGTIDRNPQPGSNIDPTK